MDLHQVFSSIEVIAVVLKQAGTAPERREDRMTEAIRGTNKSRQALTRTGGKGSS